MKKAITKKNKDKKVKLNKFQKKHVMQRCSKCCENCINFTPIGEGDHICIANEPVLILDDYMPTENYFYCKGKQHQTWDDI